MLKQVKQIFYPFFEKYLLTEWCIVCFTICQIFALFPLTASMLYIQRYNVELAVTIIKYLDGSDFAL